MGMFGGSSASRRVGGATPGSATSGVVGTAGTIADPTAPPPTVDKLTQFEGQMQRLEEILHSPKDCEFTAVTIPTELATAETKRLLDALQDENILVRRLIINQVMPDYPQTDLNSSTIDISPQDRVEGYIRRLRAGQDEAVKDLQSLAVYINVPLIQVPHLDTEVRTVFGLRVVRDAIFSSLAKEI